MKRDWLRKERESLKFFFRPTKFKVFFGLLLYLVMPFYSIFSRCYGSLCPKFTFYGGILILKETVREMFQGIPSDFFVAILFQLIALIIPYLIACLLFALYLRIKRK